MSNKETITCDYAGCDKPFAYRVKGFNLCAKHLFEGEQESRLERLQRIVEAR